MRREAEGSGVRGNENGVRRLVLKDCFERRQVQVEEQLPPPPPPPGEPAGGVSKKTFATVVIVLAIVIGLLLVGFGFFTNLIQRILPPNVEVVSTNARTGFIGLDYTVWVDVTVHNKGGPGTVTVWVEVTQGANSWRKSLNVHLEPRETKTLTFTFKEFSFWSLESGWYRVWVEY